jgi:hypothetical protein
VFSQGSPSDKPSSGMPLQSSSMPLHSSSAGVLASQFTNPTAGSQVSYPKQVPIELVISQKRFTPASLVRHSQVPLGGTQKPPEFSSLGSAATHS